MSETVNQNSPLLENQVPEHKKWKKSSMRKWTGLVLLISVLLVFAGIPFGLVFWINVALLIVVEIYGRVTGKMKIVASNEDSNEKWANTPGHDAFGNYVGYRD